MQRRHELDSQRQEALTRISDLDSKCSVANQRADGLHKLLQAALSEGARIKQEHGLLKRAVEVHDARGHQARTTMQQQGDKITQLTQLAENLYQSNQSLMTRLAAQGDGNGVSCTGDQHYPHWGDAN